MTNVGRTSETFPEHADLRRVEYRREVFLRFYDFHLRYRAHPGGVYQFIPWLSGEREWTIEETLWFAFINGNTQNPMTSLLIFDAAPEVSAWKRAVSFWRNNYGHLPFDTDRRHHKRSFDNAADSYVALLSGRTQKEFWTEAAAAGWDDVWRNATSIHSFGRLSAFSFAEYLRVAGMDFDCADLLLGDRYGSRSHRNGLCIVTGRDEYDWHNSNPTFSGAYPPALIRTLEAEASDLLIDARSAASADYIDDVSYFTLESALCTYKSWHRPNRRYPNVYNDMAYDRLRQIERLWPDRSFDIFWEARAELLPQRLRLEDSPYDPGYCSAKQNHYRLTGQVVMMDGDYPDMRNDFNDAVDNRLYGRRPT